MGLRKGHLAPEANSLWAERHWPRLIPTTAAPGLLNTPRFPVSCLSVCVWNDSICQSQLGCENTAERCCPHIQTDRHQKTDMSAESWDQGGCLAASSLQRGRGVWETLPSLKGSRIGSEPWDSDCGPDGARWITPVFIYETIQQNYSHEHQKQQLSLWRAPCLW